ncbi:MAG: anthranilate synthase component I family protein [Flavobacteriia bacterium]|jgi:anthranilate synthase component 1
MKIFTQKTVFNTDTFTPVGMFLNLRNHFSKIALLESNDYRDRSESKSFLALNPLLEIRVQNNLLELILGDKVLQSYDLNSIIFLPEKLNEIIGQIDLDLSLSEFNGFFGFVGFEFAHLIEKHILKRKSSLDIPDLQLYIYEYVVVLDHFKNEGYILHNQFKNEFPLKSKPLELLQNKSHTPLYFEKIGEEKSSFSDEEYMNLVSKAKEHCKRGDVFQLVLSRDFSQAYFGDDFEVYRSLRNLNPSPYLFYFDFGTHRIFGSSPEAQLKINKQKAEIHPIAGTVKKTGDSEVDEKSVSFLIADKKENAEHTMLVDLARNDLSKNCTDVKVEKYKEIQEFSHVIHLVSKVTGIQKEKNSVLDLFANTFPAGTLSGTPKPKALELIAKYEKTTRDYYGGAIGFMNSAGILNFAIVIRSILSKNQTLHYRAGAGIVIHSDERGELNEITNKLGAIRKALELAQQTKLN